MGPSWNVFDLFITIETKINFSVDFLFNNDRRLNRLECRLRQSRWLEEPLIGYGEQGFGQFEGESRRDSMRRRARKFDPTKESQRLDIIVAGKASSNGRHASNVSSENRRSASEDIFSAPFNFSRKQIILLWLNFALLCGLIIKLTLCSSKLSSARFSHDQTLVNKLTTGYNETKSLISSSRHQAVEQFRENQQRVDNWHWQRYIAQVLFCDLFENFTNHRMTNMVAAGALIPSALFRFISVKRHLGYYIYLFNVGRRNNKCSNSNNSVGSCDVVDDDRDDHDISCDTITAEARTLDDNKLNIVQTNLCYLKSLKTSSSCWYKLLIESWFHEHKFASFKREREKLTEFVNNDNNIGGSGGGPDDGMELSSIIKGDLITRLYCRNLINFNACYANYFKPEVNSSKNIAAKDTETTRKKRPAAPSDRATVSQSHIGLWPLSVANDANGQVIAEATCSENKEDVGKRANDIFVAKPLHRIDLNEMGWLLLMLLVLYVLSALTIIAQVLLSLLIEAKISSFCEISLARLAIGLRQVMTSLLLVRWTQMFLLQVIIILTIFDLYQFFACCLICLSRAKYLKLRLEQMRSYCYLTNYMLQRDRLQNDSEPRLLLPLTLPSTSRRIGTEPERHFARSNHVQNALITYESDSHHYNYRNENLRTTYVDSPQIHLCKTRGSRQLSHLYDEHYRRCGSSIENLISVSGNKLAHYNLTSSRRQSDSTIAIVDTFNEELWFVMDLILLVQRELVDLKNFFHLYLSLELAIKSICVTFTLIALLDSKSTIEFCFILITANTCSTPIGITLITAAFIENEFKAVCRNLDHIIANGSSVISVANIRRLISLSNFLSIKSNRSFVIAGNFSLSIGSLVPIFAWVASGVVLLRRN